MPNNKYTHSDKQFVVKNYKNKTIPEFAEYFGISKTNFVTLCNGWREEGYKIPYSRDKNKSKKVGYKFCFKCKEEKEHKHFGNCTRSKDQLSSYCKSCTSDAAATYREKNGVRKTKIKTVLTKQSKPRKRIHNGVTNNNGFESAKINLLKRV